MVFGRKKHRKELEICHREIEESKQKLLVIQKQFNNYKREMELKLTKKEEIIRKFGDRWSSLEIGVVKKEEELMKRLEDMNKTQKKVIENLINANNVKVKTIELQKECMDKQCDKVKVQEDLIERTKQVIESLSKELNTKDTGVKKCVDETEKQKKQIVFFDEEISGLKEKTTKFLVDAQDKLKSVESLQIEVMSQKKKLKEVERKLYSTEEANSELVKLKKELETKSLREEELLKNMKSVGKELEDKIKELNACKNTANRLTKTEEDLANAVQQSELLKKGIEEKTKEIRNLKNMSKLKEEMLRDELTLKIRDETVERLSEKWQTLEKSVSTFETKCKKDLEKANASFAEKIKEKNDTIERLTVSEKRAVDQTKEAEATIRYLENESAAREIYLHNKEKEVKELHKKLKVILRENKMLQFNLFQAEVKKAEDLITIESQVEEQLKKINETFQKQQDIGMATESGFICLIVETISNIDTIMRGLRDSMRCVDLMEENIERLIKASSDKVESCTGKIEQCKEHLESLQVKTLATEVKNKELREKLAVYDDIQRQMNENLKLLYRELNGIPEEEDKTGYVPQMDLILREVRKKNVAIQDLRHEVEEKHDALLKIQDRYTTLSKMITKVTTAVAEAKDGYRELEKENHSLRELVKKLQRGGSRRAGGINLDTQAAYDMHVSPLPLKSPVRRSPPTPLDALTEQMVSVKNKNKNNILRVAFRSENT